ncbi:MAG: tetratricopeptide repeat protein [Alphaproteobacteria bacterium]
MGANFSPSKLAALCVVALCVVAMVGAGQPALADATKTTASDTSLFGSYLAGRHAIATRDRENAARFFSDSLTQDPENRMLLERTFAYQASSGNIEDALKNVGAVLAAAPRNLGANLLLGLVAFAKGEFATARGYFAKPEDGPISRLVTGLLTAWAFQGENQHLAALGAVKKVGDQDTARSFQKYNAALLTDLQGDVEAARRAYGVALDLGSDALRAVQAAGRFEERAGGRDRAIEIYQKFLSQLPRHPSILAAMRRVKSGQVPSRLVVDVRSGAAEALYTVGSALTQDNGGDLALVYLHMALYLRPDFPVAQFLVADILDRQRRLEKSNEMYAKIDPNSPLKREARIQMGLNLNDLNRTDEAKVILDEIIAADPSDRSALESTANMLRLRMRYKEAEPYFTRAVKLIKTPVKSDWRIFYSRAITYERLKQWPASEKDFLKALELNPDQPLVLNYLGYSWIDMHVHLDRAMAMVRKAVDQRPNDGYIVDSLGWAYYRIGKFEKAVEELERAAELRADDSVINDHLGDAYWQVGRRLEAKFQWSHALEMKPADDQIALIKAKLENGLPAPTEKKPNPKAASAASPAPAPPPETTKTAQTHVVQAGDSLWDIAKKYFGYGAAYGRIFKANQRQLRDAGRIFPGQTLILPSSE